MSPGPASTAQPAREGTIDSDGDAAARARHARERSAWLRNLRWIAALLTVWFVVTFVVSWYARELSFPFFGWRFSFWVGAQGALVIYVLMAALYAWAMNRADDELAAANAAAAAPVSGTPSRTDPADAA